MCPEFNRRVGRIDVFGCPSGQTGCPTTIFWSNAVFLCELSFVESKIQDVKVLLELTNIILCTISDPECYRNSTKAALSTTTTSGIHVTM